MGIAFYGPRFFRKAQAASQTVITGVGDPSKSYPRDERKILERDDIESPSKNILEFFAIGKMRIAAFSKK
jgi:hypothetical protein